ncbi:protein SPEC3-like [Xenia sp. Carnegie-2017]|uniref:protein SPEC3-like n=1 Tax=Xenia sp. Carnegie-2017 TaxID=2897299 RepID=UPI001F04F116|nr:protein SPEC3-like [Xenia sp. Carnegie-2017]
MTRMARGQDSQEHGEHESHMTNSEVDETTAAKQRRSIVAIPILPRPFAIFCLVANIVLPGTGTIASAFSIVFFHRKDDSHLEIFHAFLSNFVIGLCQFITIIFFLIGWFWSILWGCALVGHSNKYRK